MLKIYFYITTYVCSFFIIITYVISVTYTFLVFLQKQTNLDLIVLEIVWVTYALHHNFLPLLPTK